MPFSIFRAPHRYICLTIIIKIDYSFLAHRWRFTLQDPESNGARCNPVSGRIVSNGYRIRKIPAKSPLALLLMETFKVVLAPAEIVPEAAERVTQLCPLEALQVTDVPPVF